MISRADKIRIVSLLLCLPLPAPAGCPLLGGKDGTCASDSSSIDGCTNSLWDNYQGIKYATEGLQRDPKNPAERLQWIQITKFGLISKIQLLGAASTYKGAPIFADCITSPGPAWAAIGWCESQLESARNGIKLLSKQEVVDILSSKIRERLSVAYTHQATLYKGRLDIIAASWTGDPSLLCNEVYASVSACKRSVEMDTDALDRQVFPVYRCGRIVPGQFVTATKGATEEARHANDPPSEKMLWRMSTLPFSDAVRLYQGRLAKEKLLLSQAQAAHQGVLSLS